jgi:hypothetical protein
MVLTHGLRLLGVHHRTHLTWTASGPQICERSTTILSARASGRSRRRIACHAEPSPDIPRSRVMVSSHPGREVSAFAPRFLAWLFTARCARWTIDP